MGAKVSRAKGNKATKESKIKPFLAETVTSPVAKKQHAPTHVAEESTAAAPTLLSSSPIAAQPAPQVDTILDTGAGVLSPGSKMVVETSLPGVPQEQFESLKMATEPEEPPPQPAVQQEAEVPSQPADTEAPLCCLKQACNEEVADDTMFDLPLDEVVKAATEAFGQIASSLSCSKWDRRVQAMKGITSVLKGLDIKGSLGGTAARGLQLRDHAGCFNAACLVLNIVMKDKVLPVVLAAHELYKATMEHGKTAVPEAEARRAANALFPHILAKLGDLNIKLHESACSSVLFTAMQPFVGVPSVLAKLAQVLEGKGQQAAALRGQQKMRIHYGVLQTVEQLLRQSPGRKDGEGDETDAATTWTANDVIPFIVHGLHADTVTGARVQQAALGLAVDVYAALGKAPLLPVLEKLSAGAKEMLISRFEEEGDELEDLDGDEDDGDCIELTGAESLCILGVAIRPQTGQNLTKPKTTDCEESLMDDILEDAGLVMDGRGLNKKPVRRSALDEELAGLGFDTLDGLDEDDLDRAVTCASMSELGIGGQRLRHNGAVLS